MTNLPHDPEDLERRAALAETRIRQAIAAEDADEVLNGVEDLREILRNTSDALVTYIDARHAQTPEKG